MSAYAEYKYAKTEEEREEALRGIKYECRRDMVWDDMWEREDDDYEDEEWD